MNLKFGALCIWVACTLVPVSAVYADDADQDHPINLVKDSIITTKIKAKLVADKVSSFASIKVETDNKGVVWLSGSAPTQTLIDKAEAVAHDTAGVRAVKNHITIKTDY
ncbi:BON domain-containing protein [Undibacterium sp. Dicai25W]|uniref:BON domain-containing protein n=1 Tax=Undibacterium sp. Dicai25W TaxID=3413034 RepID=UPI003BF43A67